jgi:hypothetical protein
MPKTTRTYWNPLSDKYRKGDYASRPPGEPHGPFRTNEGCLVLEVSFPSQANKA